MGAANRSESHSAFRQAFFNDAAAFDQRVELGVKVSIGKNESPVNECQGVQYHRPKLVISFSERSRYIRLGVEVGLGWYIALALMMKWSNVRLLLYRFTLYWIFTATKRLFKNFVLSLAHPVLLPVLPGALDRHPPVALRDNSERGYPAPIAPPLPEIREQ